MQLPASSNISGEDIVERASARRPSPVSMDRAAPRLRAPRDALQQRAASRTDAWLRVALAGVQFVVSRGPLLHPALVRDFGNDAAPQRGMDSRPLGERGGGRRFRMCEATLAGGGSERARGPEPSRARRARGRGSPSPFAQPPPPTHFGGAAPGRETG